MTGAPVPSVFRPPRDWEAVFAADSESYTFGEEPSQIARSALRFLTAFGGQTPGAVALDLGCGEGRDTAYLAAAGLHVVARDLAPSGLAKIGALLARRGVPRERVQAAVGDVRNFAYPPDTFDLALAANVFQFLDPDEAAAAIARLQETTRPGGICAVGVFSPAMLAWGADLGGCFTATADELMARFPPAGGWLLLDRTEYWTYRLGEQTLASFAYVVARKAPAESAEG